MFIGQVRNAKEDAENKSDKLLLKNLSVAYDQGRENAIKECVVRIDMLQQRLGDAHERYELGKVRLNFVCFIVRLPAFYSLWL